MSRALLVLTDASVRQRAIHWIGKAPTGTRVVFQAAQRSVDQNSKLWAMLSEVAAQCPWHGVKLTAEDWKFVFLDALKRELRMVPNLEGNGFVNIGRSSSNLSKAEMSDLIELIHAFGAEHGVRFNDDNSNSSQSVSSPDTTETDTPAFDPLAPNPADAGNLSSEPVEGSETATGGLPAGWQRIYADTMTAISDKPKSLATRRKEALAEIGCTASDDDKAEMAAIEDLVKRRNSGELLPDAFSAALREILPAGVTV